MCSASNCFSAMRSHAARVPPCAHDLDPAPLEFAMNGMPLLTSRATPVTDEPQRADHAPPPAPPDRRCASPSSYLPPDLVRYIYAFAEDSVRFVARVRSLARSWAEALSPSALERFGLECVSVAPYLPVERQAHVRTGPHTKSLRFELFPDTAKGATASLLSALMQRCPQLQRLHVLDCRAALSDAPILVAFDRCRELRVLHLIHCRSLTDATIAAATQGCAELRDLRVYGCSLLTDASIIAVAERCGELQSLAVGCCKLLTDASIIAVAERCGKLQSLAVGSCKLLTDMPIIAVAERCGQLQNLAVDWCELLTDASIIAVAERCGQLQILSVNPLPVDGRIGHRRGEAV
jgi:hypothetical protein